MNKENLDTAFSEGGEEVLEYAMDVYGQALLRYCHNILCDYEDAKDAVQLVFIKAYNNRKSFQKGTKLSAWLYRIAYTTCIDMLRKRKWHIFQTVPVVNEEYMSETLQQALLKLSGEERALIFSRVVDAKSYAELEDIYQIPQSTLRKRYERAKNKLAKTLKQIDGYYSRLEEQL
ncbi:MAG: RNA polymerase sigma factor [Cellulosilyticaceae bacterium]